MDPNLANIAGWEAMEQQVLLAPFRPLVDSADSSDAGLLTKKSEMTRIYTFLPSDQQQQ